MRKYVLITTLCLIMVLIEESFLLEFFGSNLNPILILALSFAFIFNDAYEEALFSAFCGGLFIDLLGVGIVGLSSFVLVLFLFLALWIRKTLFRGIWIQLVLLLTINLVLKLILSYPVITFQKEYIYSGLLSVVLSMFFHWVISKTKHRYLSTEYRIKA